MMYSENIRMAMASIRKSRMRSFFTMLGIIIGVVSVITIVSLGEGVKRQVSGQINLLGSNLITVRPGKLVNRDAGGNITSVNLFNSLSTSTLNEADVSKVRDQRDIDAVVPLSVISGLPSYEGRNMDEAMIVATSSKFPDVTNQKLEYGVFFSDSDGGKHTAIIGRGVAEKLFRENVPISKTVSIRGQDFVVRGVFEQFPANPASPGTDFNNAIFISSDAGKALNNNQPLAPYEILVKPRDSVSPELIASSINKTILDNHAGQQDFTVFTQKETLKVATNVVSLISTMIIGMAAVSLFVGGIGIMNVMLVSVSERTREIGIRKAIGATNNQIRSQFMVESMVLSVLGAFIGIISAMVLVFVINVSTDLRPVVTWPPVMYASLISIAIGTIFGVIPAIKAARKDPIEALRPQ